MDNTLYFALAAILALFTVVLMFVDRRLWLKCSVFSSISFGVTLALLVLPYTHTVSVDNKAQAATEVQSQALQIKKILVSNDAFIVCLAAVSIFGNSFMIWLTRYTWDGTVPITIIMSGVFRYSLAVMSNLHYKWSTSMLQKPPSTVDWPTVVLMLNVSIVLLHVTHLLRSTDFSTYPQHNIRINNHLRVDSLLNFIFSVLFLAFPDLVAAIILPGVKTPSSVHLYVLRIVGCMEVGSAIMSLQAVGFLHESDKRSQFLSRILHFLMQLPLYAYFLCQNYTGQWQPAVLGIVVLPAFINACLGYYAGGTIKTSVHSKSN